ncbi:MAG TPA: sigma 54-interacting transcriptional regulator, partial [Gemmatimonadaceae bacterium]|nr:sigma 54-interacting transcriptional regulator [Gemmatimonadaceae bacterium]
MTQRLAPGPPGTPTVAVFVVDGDDARGALVAGLAAAHATVRRPATTSALRHASGDRPDCVLFAADGASATRVESLDAIRTLHAMGIPVIAYADRAAGWSLGMQAQVLLAGAASLLDSAAPDFRSELRSHLTQSLEATLDARRDRHRIATAMRAVGAVGESEPMLALFRLVLRVADLSDVPVLVHGETGTGKELVARALHLLDPKRREGAFVAVNCSAINASVAESELFGHRRGAFTGAERDRKGFFRMADGGVLFLDEIGELDADLQAKLLRVLQDHRVMGVGEDRDVPVDVRVIAATNRDLGEMASRRAFRADLLHRLNVVSIGVPTLAERRGDIPALIDHFVAKHRDLGRAPCGERCPRATAAFLAALEAIAFPGNVRQLENL